MKERLCRLLSVITVIACLIPVIVPSSAVKAAAGDTCKLLDKVDQSKFSISLTDKDDNDLTAQGVSVEYGQEFYATMNWEFLPASDSVEVGTVYTYELPTEIVFKDVPSGKILENQIDIGDFSIVNNVISISYSSSDFCDETKTNRKGSLTFSGKITDDGRGGKAPEDITVTFPGLAAKVIKVVPPTVEAALAITKRFEDREVPNLNLLYDCYIRVTSTSVNTNVSFYDEMWPGMSLYTVPEIYTDAACTQVYTGKHTDWDINYKSNEMRTVFDGMSDGEELYIKYTVQANPDMYDWDTANDFASNYAWAYPSGYRGKIPNYASVESKETIELEKPLACVWADIYTLHVSFEKFTNQGGSDLDHGMLSWYLYVHQFEDDKITTGYIVDYLPADVTIDMNSFSIFNGSTGVFYNVDDYIQAVTKTVDGKTVVEFHFKDEMIKALRTQNLYFQYKTKVDAQTDDKFVYHNAAEIVLNGTTQQRYEEDFYYTKPDELVKTFDYSKATAPYANFNIVANPAALDMDPNSDTLILEDTMGEAFDLDMSSVLVNGVAPSSDSFTYDPTTKTFQLVINDATYYEISYRATVNLVPGSTFENNSGSNDCKIIGITTKGTQGSKVITGSVYQSAANSSAETKPYLNIVKHDASSVTDTLPGAKFSITACSMSGNVVTVAGNSPKTGESGDSGLVSFDKLNRGTVYMITETAAPEKYVKDDEPRFIVFADNSAKYPETITFDGEDYSLIIVNASKVSYDMYWENEVEPTTTPEPSPSSSVTPEPSPSPSVTPEPSPVVTPTPTVTPEPTPVVTPEPTPVVTPEPTPVPTPTPTSTPVVTPPVDIDGSGDGGNNSTTNDGHNNTTTSDDGNKTTANNAGNSSNSSAANSDTNGIAKTGEVGSNNVVSALVVLAIAAFTIVIRFTNKRKA
ncbi:MAG: hypothetical protein MJ166_09055 [Clostridia bacterium]|nr:hypothetical protein [Clostridia bacterium]